MRAITLTPMDGANPLVQRMAMADGGEPQLGHLMAAMARLRVGAPTASTLAALVVPDKIANLIENYWPKYFRVWPRSPIQGIFFILESEIP